MLAILAPFIARRSVYWDITDPNAPSTTEVLEFDGYPRSVRRSTPSPGTTRWASRRRLAYDNLAYLVCGLRRR